LGGGDSVVQTTGGVVERGPLRGTGLELLTEGDEVLPRAEPGGELVGVAGDAGLLEQVGAVAQRHRADVAAQAEHASVGGGGGVGLPADVVADPVRGGGLAQVEIARAS